jgi:hypothetical protein
MRNVVPITFTLPPDLVARVDRIAEADERSRSFVAARALQTFCDANEIPPPQSCPAAGSAPVAPTLAKAPAAPAACETSAALPSGSATSWAASFSPVKDTEMDNPQSAPKPPPTPGLAYASALCDTLDLHADALARAQATHREKADAAERARADTAQRIAASLGCTDQGGR